MSEYIETSAGEIYFDDDRDIQREIRRKNREKRKRRKKLRLPVFLLIVAVIAGLVYFAQSEYFDVSKIKVKGNDYYSTATIKEMSGAEKGVNIFAVKTGSMEKLLESDPYILEAEVTRSLPATIVITVGENEECVAVLDNKNYYVIDKTGLVLKIVSKKPKNIPIASGFNVSGGEEGEALKVEETKDFKAMLDIMESVSKTKIVFTKILFKNSICYAYVKKHLYVRGVPENIIELIDCGTIEATIYDLYERGVTNGAINTGDNLYCVFAP